MTGTGCGLALSAPFVIATAREAPREAIQRGRDRDRVPGSDAADPGSEPHIELLLR